jgi:8-oxo-dGTP pyrophosphatase MutT (NUDIX family)
MALTRREFSAGGVIYKKTDSIPKVALIARHQNIGGQAKKGKKVWCLPKGKIEKEESSESAAEREIREETGLTGRLIKLLGSVTYWYVSSIDKARVFKNVRFFLFEYIKGTPGSHDAEISQVNWFAIPEALEIMTYPSERRIMQRAAKEICP